jgi:hypothetical protein
MGAYRSSLFRRRSREEYGVGISGATDFKPAWRAGQGIGADLVIVHEKYNKGTHENDLALVKLKSSPNGEVIPRAALSLVIPVWEPPIND